MTLIYRSVMALAVITVLIVSGWSLVGIFNDDVVLFRYMNYFGYYMPIISVLALIIGGVATARTMAKPLWVILPVSLLALPGLVLPYILATADLGGEKTALINVSIADSTPFTVMTFSKMSRNRNYEAIADLLDCKKYDAILMQEASDFTALSTEQPSILRDCNTSFVGNQYKSLVLLTPHKITAEQSSKFGNLFVIELPGGGPVALLTNRVDKTLNKPVALQQSQVESMLSATQELRDAGTPTIIAGDFNATPFNTVHYYMREAMAYARPAGIMNQTFTFPAEGRRMGLIGPQIRIDHIFYTGMQLKRADVLDTSAGSDHYPVRAEFLLPKQVIKDTE